MAPAQTVVHLVRHGEVFNPTGVLYGRLPGFGLSKLGREMADRVAEWSDGRDIATLRCSPLERARQTAAPIASEVGLPVEADDRLIEPTNVFEGKRVSVGDGVLRDPRHWRYLWNPFRPSWGEPYADVARRMRPAILDARDAALGREAVLVSHQLPIWMARMVAEGRHLWHDPRRRECALASITSMIFEGPRLAGISYTEPAQDLVERSNKGAGA